MAMEVSPLQFNLLNVGAILSVYKLLRMKSLGERVLQGIIISCTAMLSVRLATNMHQKGYSFQELGQYLKIICVLPLGFGAVLQFRRASDEYRERNMSRFTRYINAAVLGNIVMMLGAQTDSVRRGMTHRIVCILLVLWLVQEMRKVNWATVHIEGDERAFVFIASPPQWVICHALYRAIMVTLPGFDTKRYLLLEASSLGMTWLLYRAYGNGKTGRRASDYFGFADTLVAATTALSSALFPSAATPVFDHCQDLADAVAVPIHICIAFYAILQIWRNAQKRPRAHPYQGDD